MSSFKAARSLGTVALLMSVGAGCGSAPTPSTDERFKAETWDEYKEPLRNATIVDRSQIIEIPGETTPMPTEFDGGMPPPPPRLDGGAAGGPGVGTGGSFGAGGSGLGGSGGGFGKGGGSSFDGGTQASGPSGFWRFDDCSPQSNFLADSSGNNVSAQHELNGSCVPGISNLGIQFAKVKDVVQVPDQPQFTVGERIAVAAWVNPTTVDGDQPIVLKRLNNQTAFSLGVHKGNIEMAVTLTDGHTFISRAPIQPNVFTHVAGMYDGRFLFLFINGEQFGQVFGGLPVRNVFAPIRIGATTQTQSFHGVIDEVWVSTNAVSKEEVQALSCISRPFSLAVSPASSGPVQPGTTVPYTVSVTNNDVGACQPTNYDMFVQQVFPGRGGFPDAGGGDSGVPLSNNGINTVINPPFISGVSPGATVSFEADVTGSEDAEPGVHHIPFTVIGFGQNFTQQNGELVYELSESTGCNVKTKRELMITSTWDPLESTCRHASLSIL